MLSTPAVNNRLLPYGSIIIRILRHFRIPITELVYDETKRLGGEIILGIGFHRRNGEWVNITSYKNEDTLLGPEDDCLLNDIYYVDQHPDFRLGSKPRVPCQATVAHAGKLEKHDMDVPPAPADSLASKGLSSSFLARFTLFHYNSSRSFVMVRDASSLPSVSLLLSLHRIHLLSLSLSVLYFSLVSHIHFSSHFIFWMI